MDSGQLVPDEIVIELVKQRLARPDHQSGVILDGFPRTIKQAEALDDMFSATGRSPLGLSPLMFRSTKSVAA